MQDYFAFAATTAITTAITRLESVASSASRSAAGLRKVLELLLRLSAAID